ncbi:pyrroline-5-carboxylate reductase [Prosthecomicrobium sp. N25]|uniref:pyrroline-5-carboxylate reductase n=1 Tax=Prosthecomicrobium sp. N25 TaxID=3129254 RepID=UPI003077325D
MSELRNATPLVLVGAGKMGGAMLAGWLERGLDPAGVVLVDPSPASEMRDLAAARGLTLAAAPPPGLVAAVVVVAVKPQVLDGVLPALRPLLGPGTVTVSVAAGKTLAKLEAGLGGGAVVRTMPNTPAQVGRGITVAVPNAAVTDAQKSLVTALLAAVGKVDWVDDEALIDAVTAVSGSGPAYVFLLAEALAEAGRKAGLPDGLAERLARATVEGAGELLHQSPLDPATLRRNVTSPNGTTAAALDVLMAQDGLQPLLDRAVAAAARRSRELAG